MYDQDGGRRRSIFDNAKRHRIENHESSSEAYVVEELGRAAMAEQIEICRNGGVMTSPAQRHFQRIST
ncbi:MAG TPA: P2 family phage major capsid protein [Paraburkholderia sp.]|nr:P2 family phage major capsid protein [Paraburkholderia sp.]